MQTNTSGNSVISNAYELMMKRIAELPENRHDEAITKIFNDTLRKPLRKLASAEEKYEKVNKFVQKLMKIAKEKFNEYSYYSTENDESLKYLQSILTILEFFEKNGYPDVKLEVYKKKFEECVKDNIDYKLKKNTHTADGIEPTHVFVVDCANNMSENYNTDRYAVVGRIMSDEIFDQMNDKYDKIKAKQGEEVAKKWIKSFSSNPENIENKEKMGLNNYKELINSFVRNIKSSDKMKKIKNIKIAFNWHGTGMGYIQTEDNKEAIDPKMVQYLFKKIQKELPGYNIEIINMACYNADYISRCGTSSPIHVKNEIEKFAKRYVGKKNCVTYASNFSNRALHNTLETGYGAQGGDLTDKSTLKHDTFEYQVFDKKTGKLRVACDIENKEKYDDLKNRVHLDKTGLSNVINSDDKDIKKHALMQKEAKDAILYGKNKNLNQVIKGVKNNSVLKYNMISINDLKNKHI